VDPTKTATEAITCEAELTAPPTNGEGITATLAAAAAAAALTVTTVQAPFRQITSWRPVALMHSASKGKGEM